MTEIVLEKLSGDELMAIAKDAGLKPRANVKREKLISMIKEDFLKDVVESPDSPEEAVADKQSAAKKYLLTINSDSDVAGNEPAKIGINGDVTSIPRDIEVEVNEDIISALNDMIVSSYYQDGNDDEGRPIYKERHHKRFSFSYRPSE